MNNRGTFATRLIVAATVLLGCAMLLFDGGKSGEQVLRNLRDSARQHSISGEIAIVEIDAKSLKELDSWPWPRKYHAALVDQLRLAGVRTTAFDVDFSASANPDDDAALAQALARAEGAVVLSTFRQTLSANSTAFSENLPIPALRRQAFLASVNIHPDAEGQVREYVSGVETDKVIRPSLAAMLAEASGKGTVNFVIDQAIDPSDIPRFSFVDVMKGRVPAPALKGKRVVIGATAIELGDRYAVPRHGVLPGVVIQAMAAETLLQGTTNPSWGGLPLLLIAIMVLIIAARAKRHHVQISWLAAGSLFTLLAPLALEWAKLGTLAVIPALTILFAANVALGIRATVVAFQRKVLIDDDTGLPNARAFARTSLTPGQIVVAGRLARFGETQSVLGPEATNEVLRRAAERMALVALNNDVFLLATDCFVWIADTADQSELDERISALSSVLRSPIQIGNRAVELVLSFGAVAISDEAPRAAASNALVAADHAAEHGLRWAWHNASLGAELDWKLALLGELDAALAAGQLFVAYQPKADIASGVIIGCEALVRWQHPERGMIPPDHFIPVIEQAGRIRELTLFVLERALADLAIWRAGGAEVTVAVNVSTPLLDDPTFADDVAAAIDTSGVDAEYLTLEITESAALADPERAVAAMKRLRALGLELSIDDYGTGQSTLSYLKRLPANEIKIDKSFITDLVDTRNDQILVRSTIDLAHELGFKVVAEGIEGEACLAMLRAMGCDTAQGWHIGKPMPADAFADRLRSDSALAA